MVRRASVKLATRIEAMPNPWRTSPAITVLNLDSIGRNDVGPIKQNPVAIKMLPINADTFGCKHLSTIHPQKGAVTA